MADVPQRGDLEWAARLNEAVEKVERDLQTTRDEQGAHATSSGVHLGIPGVPGPTGPTGPTGPAGADGVGAWIGPDAPADPAYVQWVDTDAVPLGPLILSGTGFPEGVVTAPVGSTYTDTAATNGAIRWIKATGAGNTGWVVEYGDTDWRDVSASGAGGTTLTGTYIRRIGAQVVFSCSAVAASGAGLAYGTPFYVPPTGFAAAIMAASAARNQTTGGIVLASVAGSGVLLLAALAASESAYLSLAWTTATAWPVTLPGTPV